MKPVHILNPYREVCACCQERKQIRAFHVPTNTAGIVIAFKLCDICLLAFKVQIDKVLEKEERNV